MNIFVVMIGTTPIEIACCLRDQNKNKKTDRQIVLSVVYKVCVMKYNVYTKCFSVTLMSSSVRIIHFDVTKNHHSVK
jgi:hypothetical protein